MVKYSLYVFDICALYALDICACGESLLELSLTKCGPTSVVVSGDDRRYCHIALIALPINYKALGITDFL